MSHCALSHFGPEAKRKLSLVTLIASAERGIEGAGVLFHCGPSHLGQEVQRRCQLPLFMHAPIAASKVMASC